MNSLLLTDGYKTGHHLMYPEGTSLVYSNMTARSDKYASEYCKGEVVNWGQQVVLKWLVSHFDDNFFSRPKNEVISSIKKDLSEYLGTDYDTSHFEKLHDLQYIPLVVKALPEGSVVPIKVPFMTFYNTGGEDFAWVTNYFETIFSNKLWQSIETMTTMRSFMKIAKKWYERNDVDNIGFMDFCFHNFAMRGMSGLDATLMSGMAFAMYSKGSDSLPVIQGLKDYYGVKDCQVFSLNATEHSVMSAGGKDTEIDTFRRLLKLFPTGGLSVVSDTWDLWNTVDVILPELKDEIMSREGALIIRPDSSPTTPADIICSTKGRKGLVQSLWDIFGGTVNSQGYKVLDSHIGAIYGEAIDQGMADEIYSRLDSEGFAASNIVMGVGSYVQTYNTRDTHGMAVKATYIELEKSGCPEWLSPEATQSAAWTERREIFKDPKTSSSFNKKSLKGLIKVVVNNNGGVNTNPVLPDNQYIAIDQVTWEEEALGSLREVFRNGKLLVDESLETIRERVKLTL